MIVLLALIACFAGAAAYMTGREVRAALEARPRDRHGLLRRRPAYDDHARIYARDYAPAKVPAHQSLDSSPTEVPITCRHLTRPAAVVPYAHNAPVAWVCPDCDATVPEPPPLGPRDGRRQAYADGLFIDPQLRGPGARSDRDTASSLSGTVSTGSTRITAGSITADRITASAVMSTPAAQAAYDARAMLADANTRLDGLLASADVGDGHVELAKSDYDEVKTLMNEAKEARARIDQMEAAAEAKARADEHARERREVAAERERLIRTFSVPAPVMALPGRTSITYDSPAERFRIQRGNLVEFMRHAGHTHDQIVAALNDFDARHRPDDRPSAGWTLPH